MWESSGFKECARDNVLVASDGSGGSRENPKSVRQVAFGVPSRDINSCTSSARQTCISVEDKSCGPNCCCCVYCACFRASANNLRSWFHSSELNGSAKVFFATRSPRKNK